MKKKSDYIEVLASILLFIAVSLSLIFTFGQEWYKFIPFTVVGAATGLIFYDAKKFFGLMSTALGSSRVIVSKIKALKKKDRNEKLRAYAKAFDAWPFFLTFLILVAIQLPGIFGEEMAELNKDGFPPAVVCFFVFFIDIVISAIIWILLFSFDLMYVDKGGNNFEVWSQELPWKWQVKIWGRQLQADDKADGFPDKSWPEIKKAIRQTILRLQFATAGRRITRLIGALAIVPIFLVTLLVQVIVFFPILVAMIFREMNRSKYWFLIIFSGTVGTIIGTWQHSYILGFGSGTILAALGFLVDWIDQQVMKIKMVNSFRSGPYVSVYQGIRKVFFTDNRPVKIMKSN